MSKDRYRISVSYDSNKYESLDDPAKKIAKIEVAGGGTDLNSGCRDLSFYYPTLRKAENAIERFRKDGRFRIEGAPTPLIEW